MKSFLLSLRFVIKRVFRLTAVNIVWLICFAAVIVAITVGMAVAPEIRGSDDYPFYLTTVPFITVLLFFRRVIVVFGYLCERLYPHKQALQVSADEGCAGIFADNERCGSDTCDYCYRCCEPFRSARLFAYIGNNNRRQSAACIDLFSYVDRLLRIFDIQPDSGLFRGSFYGGGI